MGFKHPISGADPQPNVFPMPAAGWATGTHEGPVVATAYPGVHVRVALQSGYGTVTLEWFSDPLATIGLGSDTWVVGPCNLSVVVPAKGPYWQVSVDVTSPGNLTGTSFAGGAHLTGAEIAYQLTNVGIYISDTLIPSQTKFYPLQWITKGIGALVVAPLDSAAQVGYSVVTLNPSGTTSNLIWYAGMPAASIGPTLFAIPDTAVGLLAANTDATSGHSFRASLVPA